MGNNLIRGTESIDISLNHPKITRAKIINNYDRSILKVTTPCD